MGIIFGVLFWPCCCCCCCWRCIHYSYTIEHSFNFVSFRFVSFHCVSNSFNKNHKSNIWIIKKKLLYYNWMSVSLHTSPAEDTLKLKQNEPKKERERERKKILEMETMASNERSTEIVWLLKCWFVFSFMRMPVIWLFIELGQVVSWKKNPFDVKRLIYFDCWSPKKRNDCCALTLGHRHNYRYAVSPLYSVV